MAVDFNVFRVPDGSWKAVPKARKDGLCQITFCELEPFYSAQCTGKKLGRIVGSSTSLRVLRNALNELFFDDDEPCESYVIPGKIPSFTFDAEVGVIEVRECISDRKVGEIRGLRGEFCRMYEALKEEFGQ